MSGDAAWFARRERGSLLGMRITVWLHRRFGRGLSRLLLYPIVGYFFLTDPSGRRASRAYLERIDARSRTAIRPGWRGVFRHYLEFGRAILDRVGFWMGDGDFALEVRGEEQLRRVACEGTGAVVLGSHLGSFDAMRLLADHQSPVAVHVLMFTRHAERINAIFRRLEEAGVTARSRVRVIEIRPGSFQHVLEARACVERGEVVAILADRVPPSEVRRVARVDFLGSPAGIPVGPFVLAGLLGCPVLFMVGLRRGERAYEIHVERLAEKLELPRAGRGEAVARHCQAYADRLAAYCAQAPLQWFNFFDFWDAEGGRADA
jgi:predicted LPLAT superfamily acyltransferase